MRLAGLVALLLAGIAAVFLFAPRTADRAPPRAEVAACRAGPEAGCLSEIGTILLRDDPDVKNAAQVGGGWVYHLSAMGRIDMAEEVLRARAARLADPEEAVARSRHILHDHRLWLAIRAGQSPEAALAAVPDADGGDLYVAALELLGRRPYGAHSAAAPPAPSVSDRAAAGVFARRILDLERTDAERARPHQLAYAAQLLALLDDRDGMLEAVERVRAGSVSEAFAPDVFRVAGPGALDDFLDPMRPHGGINLLRAAGAERDPDRAADLFLRAFEVPAAETPWPDFTDMGRVVQGAADAGATTTALDLARRMDRIAAAGPVPVFPHLDAAGALHDAGAPEADVRAALARGVEEFPPPGERLVAIGFHGPVLWEGSGLEEEARGRLATLHLRLGDVAAARGWIGGMRDPAAAWVGMDHVDLPEPLREVVLQVVAGDEGAETARLLEVRMMDHRTVRGGMATDADRDRLSRLAEEAGPEAGWSPAFADAVERVAARSGLSGLALRAATVLARDALDRRDGAAAVAASYRMTSIP